MENTKSKLKKIIYTVTLIGVVAIVGTYAWLSFRSKPTAMVLTIGDINNIRITLKPYQIKKIIAPQTSYETDNENDYIQVEAVNNGTTNGKIVLYFQIDSIDSDLENEIFMYTIEKSENSINYSIISEGSFENVDNNDNNKLQILVDELPENTTRYYKVYVWLNGNEGQQGNNIQGKSFSGYLNADIIREEYCKDKEISSFSECLIRNDTKTDNLENAKIMISNRSENLSFDEIAPISMGTSKSGLYQAEDDYTTPGNGLYTYYYRGDVKNNWVSFGGFLWRVIRINGNGSIRMIYSGSASSTNHTGSNAQINTGAFGDKKEIEIGDTIKTKYSNGRYGTTFVGYMYNPTEVKATHPNKTVDSNNKLNTFPTFTNINNNKNYYFFKSFSINDDCFTGSNPSETGACTLKCEKLGNDGDCVRSNWNILATAEGNYSTTDPGVYLQDTNTNPEVYSSDTDIDTDADTDTDTVNEISSTSQYIYKSDYKYTCWGYGKAVTHENSDNTTSVYITCPIVSEIIGTVANQPTKAKVRYHGLFSENVSTSNSNVKDSNIKSIVDTWYESKLLTKTDGSGNYLENYLSDEIFCNDRRSSDTFPLTSSGGNYVYGAYTRNITSKQPSFKCKDPNNPNNLNDSFTLKNSGTRTSTVNPSDNGNNALTFPVGLITADEVAYAGGKYNTVNQKYYLHTGNDYWTMSPSSFNTTNIVAYVRYVSSNGALNGRNTGYEKCGIRPVINLNSNVQYLNGTGTEADPYIITISS